MFETEVIKTIEALIQTRKKELKKVENLYELSIEKFSGIRGEKSIQQALKTLRSALRRNIKVWEKILLSLK